MSKVNTCIGFDPDNKEYLESRGPRKAAEFVNWLIKKYREEEAIRKLMGDAPYPSPDEEVMSEALSKTRDERKEQEIKIRAWLKENPYIIFNALKVRRPTNADLCYIKRELYFSKYELDVTTRQIAKILRDEMDKFDVEAYEKEREEKAGVR